MLSFAASSDASTRQSCRTYGAVGISSASVKLPGHKSPMHDVVTATAEQVANPPYPQVIYPSGTGPVVSHLANAMNPANYNGPPFGAVIQIWDASHIGAHSAPSTLTATAVNPGGVVRIAVWACTEPT